ncbi:MAG TPA: hypothetical protein VKE98_10215 [Gemmataceae bacterium]|nr:hypothetical protein [Gemmataceae bacterium]
MGQEGKDRPLLDVVKMPIRGPDQAVVGRRFTLEILVTNTGNSILKGLELLADLDAALEHEPKVQNHRIKIDPINPQNLQIVRLRLIPRKRGQAGVDITIRAPNGETQKIRHQLSVLAQEDAPVVLKKNTSLRVTITPPKDNYAGRPGVYLIYVINTGSKATKPSQDLVVTYATANLQGQILPMSGPGPGSGFGSGKRGHGLMMVQPSNPIRQTKVAFPSLDPGEGWTFPVQITPRRIGELRVSVRFAEPIHTRNGLMEPPSLASTAVQVKFDPRTMLEQLLPAAPDEKVLLALPQKLADVPEVSFEGRQPKTMQANEAFEHIAHTVDKIHHVNAKKKDAYVEALLSKRTDLSGMPMAMGDSCRLTPERAGEFAAQLQALRGAMNHHDLAAQFLRPAGQMKPEARIAAVMQVLGPESAQRRQEMIKVLATLSHAESTRALASLAIFSEEESVRRSALDVLKTRNDKDYTEILLKGMNYPWPAVAQRTGEAIAKLKRNDLLPKVVDMLEAPDPRAPQTKEIQGKKVPVVRELVKVNHLRNCLLCHAPADTNAVTALNTESKDSPKLRLPATLSLTAPVPLPNQQLPSPSPSGGYGQFSIPGTLVRIDVTYLRQDFSVKLPVVDAKPWPDMQRFDFLVRTRQVSEQEAKAYGELLRPAKGLTPYQQVALTTLRTMTGQDAEPTAAAWRRLLAEKK